MHQSWRKRRQKSVFDLLFYINISLSQFNFQELIEKLLLERNPLLFSFINLLSQVVNGSARSNFYMSSFLFCFSFRVDFRWHIRAKFMSLVNTSTPLFPISSQFILYTYIKHLGCPCWNYVACICSFKYFLLMYKKKKEIIIIMVIYHGCLLGNCFLSHYMLTWGSF